VARTLDLAPSSVTRLADRLVADRLVQRGGVPEHRGVVALSLTPTGEQLVARVLDRRRAELAGVLDCLAPDLRSAAAEALRTIHDLLGQNQSIGTIV
jgi:DNA-binding MarR family transcriptional regulator